MLLAARRLQEDKWALSRQQKRVLTEDSCCRRFASRAMIVTNRVSVNEVVSDSELARQYRTEIEQLRLRLRANADSMDSAAEVGNCCTSPRWLLAS